MLIARGANRRKELAIRLAVGASRFRLIRQMMSEGILLSLLGGLAGFALAGGLGVLNSHLTAPLGVPVESDFSLNWRAAVFAFGLAVVCGVGFSLAPALQATKADVTPALKEGFGAAVAGLPAFWSAQLADGGPSCRIAHAAADHRIPGDGNQQDQQHPNQIRSQHDVPLVHRSGA
jgi:hypothetical protein